MSTVKSKNLQIGTDGTASNNFTIYQPGTPDGTLRVGNGNAGAVTDVAKIDSDGFKFTNSIQIGTDATSTNNFTIYQPSTPDGTLRIGVGNADSPTEVAQFTSSGLVSGVSKLDTATGSAPSYSARAWVNFNGIGTVAIRDSKNVTSITDQNTGDYFVNFTTNMQSSGHSYVGCCNEEGGNPHFCNPTQGTSAGFRIRVFIGTTNAAADVSIINFAVFD